MIGMQHLWQAACSHGEEADTANIPRKRWQEVFGGWVMKDGVSLAMWRRPAGLHQVATTSSTPSTTAERMRLLLTQLQSDPQGEIPLLHQTLLMLQSAGCPPDKGSLVCIALRRCETPPQPLVKRKILRLTEFLVRHKICPSGTFISQYKVAGKWRCN